MFYKLPNVPEFQDGLTDDHFLKLDDYWSLLMTVAKLAAGAPMGQKTCLSRCLGAADVAAIMADSNVQILMVQFMPKVETFQI